MESTFTGLTARLRGNVDATRSEYSKSLSRLSSGLRVSESADDAAALSLSSSLDSRSRVFTQGISNLSDGISMAQIAEDGLISMQNTLLRINELTQSAQNDSLSAAQREAIQSEADGLVDEYNRIRTSTSFNQTAILSEQSSFRVQDGYGTNGGFQVDLVSGADDAIAYTAQGNQARVSVSSSGGQTDGHSFDPSVSDDGRFIAYGSAATNIISGDVNARNDVFVLDRVTGVTELISQSTAGVKGNQNAFNPKLSADGRFVVFNSISDNLVAGDLNGCHDIFIRDRVLGTTTKITAGDNNSIYANISADGGTIVFESGATNLVVGDTNGSSDIFRYDVATGNTKRISVSDTGVEGIGSSTKTSVSEDGRFITYISLAGTLVAGDTNLSTDVFIYDSSLQTTTLVGKSTAGILGNAGSRIDGSSGVLNPISRDGRYITFNSSSTNLVTGDSNTVDDVFLRDTLLGTTIRISTHTDGTEGNGASNSASISPDGKYILYLSSASNLVSGDTNAGEDYFLYNRENGTTSRISVNSAGAQSDDNQLPTFNTWGGVFSADGRSIIFQSDATNLVSGDTNGFADIFLYSLEQTGAQGAFSSLQHLNLMTTYAAENAQLILNDFNKELELGLGAVNASKSRLSVAFSNTSSAVSLLDGAVQKITEIDAAEEIATMTALKVRLNIGVAIVAQANQSPISVQSLLG
jgi:flagellin-like hook-associated protein FlgL